MITEAIAMIALVMGGASFAMCIVLGRHYSETAQEIRKLRDAVSCLELSAALRAAKEAHNRDEGKQP